MRTSGLSRFLMGAGALYAVLSLAGGGGGNSPDIGASGATIAAYAAGRGGVRSTAVLEEIALLCLIVFAAALAARIRSADSFSPLSGIVLSAGVVAVVIKLGSFAAAFALYSHPQPLQPDVARALYEMNWYGLVGSWFGQSLLLLAVAAAGLTLHAVPRWLAAGAAVVGAALLVDALAAVSGRSIPAIELAWLAWALVASIALVIRRPVSTDASLAVPVAVVSP